MNVSVVTKYTYIEKKHDFQVSVTKVAGAIVRVNLYSTLLGDGGWGVELQYMMSKDNTPAGDYNVFTERKPCYLLLHYGEGFLPVNNISFTF